MKTIVTEEGFLALWKGNLVACVRTFPSKAILFSSQDFFKLKLEKRTKNSTTINFMSGSMAGLSASIVTYPLDLLRTRLSGTLLLKSSSVPKTSVFRFVSRIVREEGLLSLYKGISPSLLGAIPMEGIRFLSVDLYNKALLKHFPSLDDDKILRKTLSGGLGGLTAGVIMYPNDTLRKNMQINTSNVNNRVTHALARLWTEGRMKRFYKGIGIYVMRIAPSSAMQFGTYEFLKGRLQK